MRDEAYLVLRDAVVSGQLAPGEVIRDVELAERLRLSRTPVREALARLTDEGLVESKPHSWTRVAPLSLRAVRDALVVVRAMHELAVAASVGRLTPAQLAEAERAADRFDAALTAGDVAEAVAADDAFHDVPVRACGNTAVAATIERYTPLVRRLEVQRFTSPHRHGSTENHRALLDALRAGDAEAAVRVTTATWDALIEHLMDQDADHQDAERPA